MMDIPTHFRRFPCMRPRIGCHYKSTDHKRLLVVGESHYLPEKSSVHRDPEGWYQLRESQLTQVEVIERNKVKVVDEIDWISTERIITGSLSEGFKKKSHGIYRNIAKEISDHWLRLADPSRAIDHIAYCNYFLRPAIKGISLDVKELDKQIAEEAFGWILEEYEPDLVVSTSSLAGSHGREVLKERNIPFTVTPHPTCRWWNDTAKKYGNIRGRDLLTQFLKTHQWHNN